MKKLSLILMAGLLTLPALTFAQDYTGGMEKPQTIVGSVQDLFVLFDKALGYAWAILSIIVVFMFLWAGFKFMTAQGDGTKVGDARKMVTWSLVGVGVMLLAGSIMAIMRTFITG
jgi:hypothetical protein